MPGSTPGSTEAANPTVSRPASPRPARRAASTPASTCASVRRAASSSTSPAAVSRTRGRRVKSAHPTCCSSRRMLWLSGGCAIPSRSAARPKCCSSATATKYRSCRRSIPLVIRSSRPKAVAHTIPNLRISVCVPVGMNHAEDAETNREGAENRRRVSPRPLFVPPRPPRDLLSTRAQGIATRAGISRGRAAPPAGRTRGCAGWPRGRPAGRSARRGTCGG